MATRACVLCLHFPLTKTHTCVRQPRPRLVVQAILGLVWCVTWWFSASSDPEFHPLISLPEVQYITKDRQVPIGLTFSMHVNVMQSAQASPGNYLSSGADAEHGLASPTGGHHHAAATAGGGGDSSAGTTGLANAGKSLHDPHTLHTIDWALVLTDSSLQSLYLAHLATSLAWHASLLFIPAYFSRGDAYQGIGVLFPCIFSLGIAFACAWVGDNFIRMGIEKCRVRRAAVMAGLIVPAVSLQLLMFMYVSVARSENILISIIVVCFVATAAGPKAGE